MPPGVTQPDNGEATMGRGQWLFHFPERDTMTTPDITDRLRSTPRSDIRELMNDAADEIERLRAEVDRLRARPCPYVTGTVTHYCTLTPFTLTDAEREAVEFFARLEVGANCNVQHANTLRALLERTKTVEK